MADRLTLCILLWAHDGKFEDLVSYEDTVLSLITEHGGHVLQRLRRLNDEGPDEVQVIEFPSEEALNGYMNDDRRLELAATRENAVARTEIYRMDQVT